MQAYEGYFENGQFYTAGRILRIPERRRAIVNILDDEISQDIEERLKEFDAIAQAIEAAADEPMPEIERIKFREADI
jgi:hypothetical protein